MEPLGTKTGLDDIIIVVASGWAFSEAKKAQEIRTVIKWEVVTFNRSQEYLYDTKAEMVVSKNVVILRKTSILSFCVSFSQDLP